VTEPGDEHRDPSVDDRGHPLAQMITIGVIASIIGTALTLMIDWFPEDAAGASEQVDDLYDVLLIASVPIFVLVMTIAIYCVFRFRAKPGDMGDGAPIHGNTRLEIFWVTVPFVLVTALAIYGWVVLNDLEAKEPNELEVRVTGQQFTWSFEYPQERVKSTELVLPAGRPVHFRVRSKDVIHSFWVPQFRLKTDAVPGMTTRLRLTPEQVGRYEVVCAELCGIGHSTMRQFVRVIEPADFDAWLSKQRGGARGGAGGAAAGKQLFTEQGCGGCHQLADAGTPDGVGPSLDNLTRDARRFGAGKTPEAYVKQSIEDPNAVVVRGFPRGVMPETYKDDLSPEQIDALARYLLSVSGGGK
jgi:cytochrome c oxidase subunit 2